ncbi:hypothetical protein GNY06_09425 [Elizabethkingia argentiflava]|uniref:Uncharacterized protein n=1 Tax=Elizabethkingia argenteiflava TaxID=2681556 RepID=A0A845PTM7_9FLAO|nr:hypothetical protein [Elizabethkingia argenteiflava]NAW51592.1 hypothetical protein [Elizabethkingia argenteiflava]
MGEFTNRFQNLPNNAVNRILFNKFSTMNDNQGPITFATLDQQIVKELQK